METAFRETQEEAGFLKKDLKIYKEAKKELNYLVKNKPKTVVYWLAELIDKSQDVKLSDEHKDFKWLRLSEACETAKYQDLQDTLKFFDSYISNNLS